MRSPMTQAARIWSVLVCMRFTGAANARSADDLAWLDKELDGPVRNIRATEVTSGVSRQCLLSGVKRTSRMTGQQTKNGPPTTGRGMACRDRQRGWTSAAWSNPDDRALSWRQKACAPTDHDSCVGVQMSSTVILMPEDQRDQTAWPVAQVPQRSVLAVLCRAA
jgi:hypothetical protein